MYQNRTLSKFLLTIFLVVCTFIYPAKSYGQTFELVSRIGAGGVGIQWLTCSTQISRTKTAYFSIPNLLVEYDSVTKKFTRRQVPFFSPNTEIQSYMWPRAMAIVDGNYVLLVRGNYVNDVQPSIVTLNKNLEVVKQIPLSTNVPIIESIEAVNDTSIRFINNQGLCQMNAFNGQIRVITANLPTGITSYSRIDDIDYVVTSTKIYRVTPSRNPRLILDATRPILSFIVTDKSVLYINDALEYVTVRNGKSNIRAYPSRLSAIDSSLVITAIYPTKLYRLANGVILSHDAGSIATFDTNYNFINRYGYIGSYSYGAPLTKDAVSENGSTAVGRVGFVSITDANGNNKDVSIKTFYNLDALPIAMTFASEQYLLLSYFDVEPTWHNGLILIDVNQGKVIRQTETTTYWIDDIEYNNNVYVAADGFLLTTDLLLSSPLERVPGINASLNLSEQGGILYVQQPQDGWNGVSYTKLSQSNEVIQTKLQSSFGKRYEWSLAGPWFYAQVLPDESFLIDRFGWTAPDDGSDPMGIDGWPKPLPQQIFYPRSMYNFMGNGKKNYFISGHNFDVWTEVYRYTPAQK